MNKWYRLHITIVVFALFTSVLTAVANVLVTNMFSFNLFSLSVWVVVPIGAGLVGFAGASGGLLACKYFNILPTKIDILALVSVAAFTMFLIYYLGYTTLVFDDGVRASTVVDFRQYLDVVITKTHMAVNRGLTDTGEVGDWGYKLLAARFVGVLVGGFAVFSMLEELLQCKNCNVYFKTIATKTNLLAHIGVAQQVIDAISTRKRDDYVYALTRESEGDIEMKVDFSLMRCPKCKTEMVSEKFFVRSKDKREFNEVTSLRGKTIMPADFDVSSFFKTG